MPISRRESLVPAVAMPMRGVEVEPELIGACRMKKAGLNTVRIQIGCTSSPALARG